MKPFRLSEFAAQNAKPIFFSVIVLCLIGLVSFGTFPVSILPDVNFPRTVLIAEAGDRPVDVQEASVTRPLEESLTGLPGVQHIRSQTERGSSEISVDFQWGVDINAAEQLVNAKVNQVRPELPAETRTEVQRMNPTVFPILGLTVESKTRSLTDLYSLATYVIKPALSRVDGVARIVVQGGRAEELVVQVDPSKLREANLNLDDVVTALSQNNTVREVGRVVTHYQQLSVVIDGQSSSVKDVGAISVRTPSGTTIPLKQIADIRSSEEDRMTVVGANGHESVLINVVRQPAANTVSLTAAVQSALKDIQKQLPKDVTIGTFYDQSILVNDAIRSVGEAVMIGAVLAVVVLLLFLHEIRATLVTASIIPVTVLITFLFMRLCGLSLNLMTLGALAVGIGLVIDDAIVVVENVFKHLTPGVSLVDAVVAASQEIARPMISSTLTTVVVFLPLSLLQGVAGAFFTALALTLCIALIVSLVLALLLSPSLCAAFLKANNEHKMGPVFRGILSGYRKALGLTFRAKWLVPLGGIAILVATYFIGSGLQTGFMPEMDEGAFVLDYVMPPGTSLDESDRILKKVDALLMATPEVESFSRRTGTELGFSITEPNRGDYAVMLKRHRTKSIDDVIKDLRKEITEQVPGPDVDFSQVLQDLIGDLAGAPAPIDIKLFGPDKTALEAYGQSLADGLKDVKGLADLKSGVTPLGPDYSLSVNPAALALYGLNTSSLADQVETSLNGTVATKVLNRDRLIPVRVRLPYSFRADPNAIANLPIETASGSMVPFSALGDLTLKPGATESFREDQRRVLEVTANLESVDLGTAVSKVKAKLATMPPPPGTSVVFAGQFASQQESFANLLQVLGLAILLVFAVMLFQFKSFTAPCVVLAVMPLALFGAVAGLALTSTPLNVSSFMGAIMLVGIVVKNGILLLDRCRELELEGMPALDAVIEAGSQRLRPILMTSLTAILGLFPLALGFGAGSEMQKPLAITVIGGLTFSTLVTLVAIPAIYAGIRDLQTRRART